MVLHADTSRIRYGDLDGDGQEEVAVPVYCSNGGGTASGQIAFGYIVVQLGGESLHAIGTVTAQRQLVAASHVTLLDGLRFEGGALVVEEIFYRSSDSTCCPSGLALTRWTYRDGRLAPGAPTDTVEAQIEVSARQAITDFLAAWRGGDSQGMAQLVEAGDLTRFAESPADWSSSELNWTQECEPNVTGSGSCTFTLVSPNGGGVNYIAYYYRVDRGYKISSFEFIGGGA